MGGGDIQRWKMIVHKILLQIWFHAAGIVDSGYLFVSGRIIRLSEIKSYITLRLEAHLYRVVYASCLHHVMNKFRMLNEIGMK